MITEDPLNYYIELKPGDFYVQRKMPYRNTDRPLDMHEDVILRLCQELQRREPQHSRSEDK